MKSLRISCQLFLYHTNFCDEAFGVLGLYFSAFPLSRTFLRWLFTAAVQTSTGSSQNPNRAGLGLCWCRFPTLSPKPHKGPHRAEFWFSHQNELTPPPLGGGAGFCSSLGFRVLLGSCLWQLLATTGSRWPNRAGLLLRWCRFPRRPTKSHTGPHRADFGFIAFFSHRFSAAAPQAGVPGDNLPPREWGGSCKAASRFSRFHPMSTR